MLINSLLNILIKTYGCVVISILNYQKLKYLKQLFISYIYIWLFAININNILYSSENYSNISNGVRYITSR